ERLVGGGVAGVDHQPLGGADLEHLARGGHHRALLVHHPDAGRGRPRPAHVVVGVEGREPDDPAEATLHAPHPLHGLTVEPAHRAPPGGHADPAARTRRGTPGAHGSTRRSAKADGDSSVRHHTPSSVYPVPGTRAARESPKEVTSRWRSSGSTRVPTASLTSR